MNSIFENTKVSGFQEELFIQLFKNDNCIIEKIISTGQSTKEGEWLSGERDEWVILLQGFSEIKFYDGKIYKMKSGDYLLIPSNTKHRVENTSTNPHCIWLAVHIK
jgi:cupin 2 domain-containing protein